MALDNKIDNVNDFGISFPDKDMDSVNLVRYGRMLLVPVQVNSSEVVHFLLDTGASHTFVDSNYIDKLRLEKVGKGRANAVGGQIDIDIYPIESIKLGSVILENTFVAEAQFENLLEGEVKGALGLDFLSRMPFTIDYVQAQLVLYNPSTFDRSLEGSISFRQIDSLIAFQATIDKEASGWFALDTGTNAALFCESRFVRQNRHIFDALRWYRSFLIGAGGIERTKTVEVKHFTTMGSEWRNIDAEISISQEPDPRIGVSGRLGSALFQDSQITIDVNGGLAWLTANLARVDIQGEIQPDASGVTPLMLAAKNNNVKKMASLIDLGVEIDAIDIEGASALHYASGQGSAQAVKKLLEAGVELDHQTRNGRTALMVACQRGRDDVVELLINRGADLEIKDTFGATALIFAVERGRPNVVKILLKNQADVEDLSRAYGTPLAIAALHGYTQIAADLIEAGADINRLDKANRIPPPIYAASQGGHVDMVRLLLDNGANPQIRLPSGRTALFWPAARGHEKVLELLLQVGIDPTLQDDSGDSAFDYAARNGHIDAMQMLYYTDDK